MATTEQLKGWALVLRDLCEQGADSARVQFGQIVVLYRPGKCQFVIPNEGTITLTDADLDDTGLIVTHEVVS